MYVFYDTYQTISYTHILFFTLQACRRKLISELITVRIFFSNQIKRFTNFNGTKCASSIWSHSSITSNKAYNYSYLRTKFCLVFALYTHSYQSKLIDSNQWKQYSFLSLSMHLIFQSPKKKRKLNLMLNC